MNEFIMKMAMPIIQNIIVELLSQENIQNYGDKLFDFIESAVVSSKTTVDDALVLPIVAQLRRSLNIIDKP